MTTDETNTPEGRADGAPSESPAASSVGSGAWFAIRGDWLHINSERLNLRTVVYYRDQGNCIVFDGAGLPCRTIYAIDAEGEMWGTRNRKLLAAIDDYFANIHDEPRA